MLHHRHHHPPHRQRLPKRHPAARASSVPAAACSSVCRPMLMRVRARTARQHRRRRCPSQASHQASRRENVAGARARVVGAWGLELKRGSTGEWQLEREKGSKAARGSEVHDAAEWTRRQPRECWTK
eukprot:5520442-Pleurochrysis_carterae.AAC.2